MSSPSPSSRSAQWTTQRHDNGTYQNVDLWSTSILEDLLKFVDKEVLVVIEVEVDLGEVPFWLAIWKTCEVEFARKLIFYLRTSWTQVELGNCFKILLLLVVDLSYLSIIKISSCLSKSKYEFKVVGRKNLLFETVFHNYKNIFTTQWQIDRLNVHKDISMYSIHSIHHQRLSIIFETNPPNVIGLPISCEVVREPNPERGKEELHGQADVVPRSALEDGLDIRRQKVAGGVEMSSWLGFI